VLRSCRKSNSRRAIEVRVSTTTLFESERSPAAKLRSMERKRLAKRPTTVADTLPLAPRHDSLTRRRHHYFGGEEYDAQARRPNRKFRACAQGWRSACQRIRSRDTRPAPCDGRIHPDGCEAEDTLNAEGGKNRGPFHRGSHRGRHPYALPTDGNSFETQPISI
jgi:hypothetical protein